MIRIGLAPMILAIAALSFLRLDAQRRKHLYGWLSSEMTPHWERLFEWKPGDIQHDAKNVLSEWVRLDPQRAGKLGAFVIFLLFIALLLK